MAKAKKKEQEENQVLNSRDKLTEDFSILSGAAIGVVILRTKEPYRMMDALKDHCRLKGAEFSVWKITNGWNKYELEAPANGQDSPKSDNLVDIIPALQAIGAPPADNAKAKGFVYAMMWPHWFCKKDGNSNIPHIIQYLADYAQLFPQHTKRLVIVVPMDYAMPTELEDCVTLVDCDLPSQEELRESYDDLAEFAATQEVAIEYDEEEINRILSAGAGMTVTEFENTLSRAIKKFAKELPDVPIDVFVRYVSITKAEIVKRSEVLELMPIGNMSDVGGLENLKEWIALRSHAFDKEAREHGVDKPKGCALIGPPGTGKSLCAKAVAHTLGLPLIRFDVSRVFSSFVGSSEGRVREALKMIKAMSPCVVMLDEVDKAFDVNSGGGDSGVGKRVLGAILTEMQESQADTFWMMTANRTDGLPPELLRKGRLDEVFSVTVPSETERMAILKIHLSKRGINPDKIEGLERVAAETNGYVGAEIENGVAEANLISYATDVPLTADLIIEQFKGMVPLSEAHKEQFQRMKEWAEQNAKPSSRDAVRVRDRKRSGGSGAAQDTLGRRKRRLDATDLDG